MNPRLISFFNLIREISLHSSGKQILCQANGGVGRSEKTSPLHSGRQETILRLHGDLVTWPATCHHDEHQSVDE
jgi:hypothetical protein